MPAPPDSSLEISVKRANEYWGADQAGQWTIVCDKDNNIVRVIFTVSEKDQSDSFDLPPFRTARPRKLQVQSFVEEGVSVQLLSHLANDIGSTVTDLYIRDLGQCDGTELKKTFLEFGKHGKVSRLDLSTLFPFSYAVSAIICLRELTSITLALQKRMMPENLVIPDEEARQIGLQLGALSCLENLEELEIGMVDDGSLELSSDYHDTVVASFMLGCASIPCLKRLWSSILDDRGARSQKSFALMLRRLPCLTDLAMVYNPESEIWREVHAVGGNKRLQKLAIYYYAQPVASLDALVASCNRDFPALDELEVHFTSMNCTPDEIMLSLAGLKSHKSLSILKYGHDDDYAGLNIHLNACQEALGEHIKVVEIPLHEYAQIRVIGVSTS